jgi:hypothetical protein
MSFVSKVVGSPIRMMWPSLVQRSSPLFPLFRTTGIRAFSSEDSLTGKVGQIDLSKKHSVVVPLGSQRVIIPSEVQTKLWQEKISRVDQYLRLAPEEKRLKLMTLSVQKLSQHIGLPTPRMEDETDLQWVFSWVTKEAEKKQMNPVTVSYSSGNIDVISSIVATVNKYFADEEFPAQARVQSVSEYFWNTNQSSQYIYPFTSDSDELHTMVEMGLPFLDHLTLYHEVGVGSGEGIIEVVRRGIQENRVPGCIVGTDLNRYSLESIRLLIEEEFGGFDNVYLRHSNAAEPFEGEQLGFSPKIFMVAANRFFSILDPKVFDSVVENFSQQMKKEGYLVAGINLESHANMEILEEMIEGNPSYSLEEEELGRVLYLKEPFTEFMKREGLSERDLIDRIHNDTKLPKDKIDISKIVEQVYYNPEKFAKKIESQQRFSVIDRRIVKENPGREVLLFKKSQN